MPDFFFYILASYLSGAVLLGGLLALSLQSHYSIVRKLAAYKE